MCSLVEFSNVAIFFKLYCPRMMESFCRGAPFVVYVEQFQCIE